LLSKIPTLKWSALMQAAAPFVTPCRIASGLRLGRQRAAYLAGCLTTSPPAVILRKGKKKCIAAAGFLYCRPTAFR
jgi:hypothetical protein